jgi:hypothetical protein
MTTTVVKVIGSTGDYTTLQAWEDACPVDLTAVDEIWQGQCQNQTFSTSSGTLLTISGTTTDATRYLELTTQAGASFVDNAGAQTNALRYDAPNGATLSSTASYAPVISVSTDNVKLQGLQVQLVAAGGGAAAVNLSLSSGSDINQCIVESNVGAANQGVVNLFGSTQAIRNSLVVCRGSAQTCIAMMGAGAKAINCTFAVPTDKTNAASVFNGAYGAAAIKNCIFNNGAALNTGGSTPTLTTCFWDHGSQTGLTELSLSPSPFQSTVDATRDYRLVSGCNAIDAGTTDSTNAANVIVGSARPQGSGFDAGCWEFVASGGGGFFARPYYDMIGKAA